MIFHLTLEEEKRIVNWKANLPAMKPVVLEHKYAYEFVFRQTGLGLIKIIKRVDGYELDLTRYEYW